PEPYDAIIIKGNTRHLRPTLYDLLAHRALEYFENDERDISRPPYAFEIAGNEAFAPADLFVKARFSTNDSLSLQHKALLIYQDLVEFHLKDAKPDALIDADLNRLDFVFENSVAENKDSLYTAALEQLIEKYGGNAVAKGAKFRLAAWYESKAATYDPLKDTTYRHFRSKARTLAFEVAKDSSVKNEAWMNSIDLLKEIERRSFSFKVEKVNLPSQPFRALVSYRNLNLLHFRLLKADEALKKSLQANDDNNNFWDILARASSIRNWQQNLPATNDFQEHHVEIKLDGLPGGEYYLVALSDASYDRKKTLVGARLLYVSNIAFVNQQDKYFVLNR
ncbi:MAG TPA: alpha-2-macroglobulin, partial [Chitinophagaceae bacterium]|nr:alpha-2-macroglobulin [Chitinophagaceae bacterium]